MEPEKKPVKIRLSLKCIEMKKLSTPESAESFLYIYNGRGERI